MRTVIIDIMTVAQEDCAFQVSERLCASGRMDPEELLHVEDGLKYHPVSGKIIAIVLLDCERDVMHVCFDDQGSGLKAFREKGRVFVPGNEAKVLRYFWKRLKNYNRFVTFNGRMYACPFLMVRSAAHSIACQRNLMPYRYSHKEHVDLSDQLTFHGACKKQQLSSWCRMFGLPELQGEDLLGRQYAGAFRFCMRRALLIRSLFWIWEENLLF